MSDKIKTVGSKAEVYHETAKHTSGGLKKKDLMKHKGRIISRKKHAAGKKAIKHLRALGYIAKKGTFKLMRKSMEHKAPTKKSHAKKSHAKKRHGKSRSTRKRGGFWFEDKAAAPSVADMMKGAMGSVNMAAAKPYGAKQ